ncbi:MAG TPA: SpoIIE family protein phosphatase [Actinocrinis sp.]|uniref:SpoIIE family protein phosphatase n=1 Tax=Actinocrinis sp. TaxID=1920516 RepID=UPI002DDD5FD3|nr:SpoIIE family protein phosphatase [Actinocrinis sp.]HEV2346741.1 SpoIIE family protein phosphatase [Actinocrinis sp.]
MSTADDEALTEVSTALFGPDPSAVGPARAFVRETIGKWGDETVVDDAVLIASELVTNAIVHAGTPAEVSCTLLRDQRGEASAVRVAVADWHPGRIIPAPRLEWDEDAKQSEGGRGLFLSAQIASAWGVQYTRAMKQVWFVLDLESTADHGHTAAPPTPPRTTESADSTTGAGRRGVQRTTVEDLDDYLTLTAEKIKALLNADGAFVLLAEDGGLDAGLRLRAETGLPPGMPGVTAPPSAAGRIGLTGLPAVYPDLAGPSDHGTPLISALAAGGMRSMATAPLTATPGITGLSGITGLYGTTGLLGVVARAPGRFTEQDALTLGEGAERIAAIVESARLAEAGRARRGALSFLAEAGELLAGSLDPERTLALAAQLVVPALARWCAVHRLDEAGRPSLALVWHADEDLHDPLEKAIIASGAPPANANAEEWPALRDVPEGEALHPGELLVVSLAARGRQLGTLTLATPAEHRFPHDTAELAWDLGRRVAVTYDSALAYASRRETAHALQSSLLPALVPDIEGADIAVVYHPAGNTEAPAHLSQDALVGGDFYDVFEIRHGCWGLAIGDVCGTGPQAAAVTGLARHALRLLAREGLRPPAVLSRLNRAILDEGERSRFLTLLYAEAEPLPDKSLALAVVCAGHPPPLVLRADGSVVQGARSQPLLGVLEGDPGFHVDSLILKPGETLLAFTDGASERRRGNAMLDSEGLAAVLADCRSMSAAGVAARIQRVVEDFGDAPLSDDMAILVVRAST